MKQLCGGFVGVYDSLGHWQSRRWERWLLRTWSLVIVRVEFRRESGDERHFDEEYDGMEERLCESGIVSIEWINDD